MASSSIPPLSFELPKPIECPCRSDHWPELLSESRRSDPRDAETRRKGDVGDVRAMTGEREFRKWADAGGDSARGYGIRVFAGGLYW